MSVGCQDPSETAADLYDHNRLEAFRLAISDWAQDKIQTIYSNDRYVHSPRRFVYLCGGCTESD